MSRSYWRAGGAALGIAFVVALPPKHESRAEQDASPYEAGQAWQYAFTRVFEEADETPALERECAQGEDNRSSDLCAQWKAADAAYSSAVWTERTFYLGVFGAVVGSFTMAAAIAAAHFAKEAARHTDAGAKAANATLTAFIEAESGILSVDTVKFVEVEKERYEISGILKNSGRTPVFITGFHYIPRHRTDKGLERIWPHEGFPSEKNNIVIEPGVTFNLPPILAGTDDPMIVCGCYVRYKTAFGKIILLYFIISGSAKTRSYHLHNYEGEYAILLQPYWDWVKGDFEKGAVRDDR